MQICRGQRPAARAQNPTLPGWAGSGGAAPPACAGGALKPIAGTWVECSRKSSASRPLRGSSGHLQRQGSRAGARPAVMRPATGRRAAAQRSSSPPAAVRLPTRQTKQAGCYGHVPPGVAPVFRVQLVHHLQRRVLPIHRQQRCLVAVRRQQRLQDALALVGACRPRAGVGRTSAHSVWIQRAAACGPAKAKALSPAGSQGTRQASTRARPSRCIPTPARQHQIESAAHPGGLASGASALPRLPGT